MGIALQKQRLHRKTQLRHSLRDDGLSQIVRGMWPAGRLLIVFRHLVQVNKWIPLRATAYYPTESVGEKQVLSSISKAFLPMASIEIDHTILGIGPGNGKITALHYVLNPEWIHLG